MNDRLTTALEQACHWIGDVAQIKTDALTFESNVRGYDYGSWRGAIRGEYSVASREWDFFGPIWHTGQAVKALCMASQFVDPGYCTRAAREGAQFILSNQIKSGEDEGCILAYEDVGDKINLSAVLECVDGLFHLSEMTGEQNYAQCAVRALDWVARTAYIPGQGKIRDQYDPKTHQFSVPEHGYTKDGTPGRPLLDDAVFLRAYLHSRDSRFETIALEIAERLIQDENPAGNWVDYHPCLPHLGAIHPRQAYWWGYPMLAVFKHTGQARYLDQFRRSVAWYKQALRKDGGLFRHTYLDFGTDCFGHATSGVCCAAIMFVEEIRECQSEDTLPLLSKAVDYMLGMQFTRPVDTHLTGVVLEKVLPPNGTDCSPYYIRDLGTIFFIQAVSSILVSQCFGD
ncbi:MAG: hypothetical protein WCL39_08985 [Armatimonadota bacterium]